MQTISIVPFKNKIALTLSKQEAGDLKTQYKDLLVRI